MENKKELKKAELINDKIDANLQKEKSVELSDEELENVAGGTGSGGVNSYFSKISKNPEEHLY